MFLIIILRSRLRLVLETLGYGKAWKRFGNLGRLSCMNPVDKILIDMMINIDKY